MTEAEPRFPLFVLISDEQTFIVVEGPKDLSWFERPDLEEEEQTMAWDREGRQYQVMWEPSLDRPMAALVAEDGRVSFCSAAQRYLAVVEGHVRKLRRRCAPEVLRAVIRQLP